MVYPFSLIILTFKFILVIIKVQNTNKNKRVVINMGEFGKELVRHLDPIAYTDLVTVLKKHNLVLGRLHIEDSKVLEMKPIQLKVGIIDLYFENNNLVYDEDDELCLDDNYFGNTENVLDVITSNIRNLLELQEDVKVASEVIAVLKRIKNINYYVM